MLFNKNLLLSTLFLSLTVAPLFGNSNNDTFNSTVATESVSNEDNFNAYAAALYADLKQPDLSKKALDMALKGYMSLKSKNLLSTKKLLTIIDFSIASSLERFFVIDLSSRKVVYHSLVAHGMNTGDNFAEKFSNDADSHKSSLGFYVTGEIYNGKHGFSMRLDGIEKGINDKARERAIVMHAADYVNKDFVKQHARLGRSHGCPALPQAINAQVIELLNGGTCLFIYYPQIDYINKSVLAGNTNVDYSLLASL